MIYLKAILCRLVGLPLPHVHSWKWGPNHTTDDVQIVFQEGACECGARAVRRVEIVK